MIGGQEPPPPVPITMVAQLPAATLAAVSALAAIQLDGQSSSAAILNVGVEDPETGLASKAVKKKRKIIASDVELCGTLRWIVLRRCVITV